MGFLVDLTSSLAPARSQYSSWIKPSSICLSFCEFFCGSMSQLFKMWLRRLRDSAGSSCDSSRCFNMKPIRKDSGGAETKNKSFEFLN